MNLFSPVYRSRSIISLALMVCLLVIGWNAAAQQSSDLHVWTPSEKKLLISLSLDKLPPLSPDPSNVVADNKLAAEFGQLLFFDARLSGNGKVSCATCHRPVLEFTDGLALAQGIAMTNRHTMTLIGAAYNSWFFWDGRKDSQWSQALEPMENPVEHGSNRMQIVRLLHDDARYRKYYETLFGAFPNISNIARFPLSAGPIEHPQWRTAWERMTAEDQQIINRIFVNIGKSIAAFERLLVPKRSRFDEYISAVLADDSDGMKRIFSETEAAGLRLFTGKAQCINCHNGPLMTNYAFHNTGVPQKAQDTSATDKRLIEDIGRMGGVNKAKDDPFNCLGIYSDADPGQCTHLRFIRATGDGLFRAYKTPGLRNVAETAPYMHTGGFSTIAEVLRHYNQARPVYGVLPEIVPLRLKDSELQDLEAFLHTLTGPAVIKSIND